ncbi:hypothetical protein NQ315_002686 [Exocentrus adspersus]|uniref:Uncharacterized protein n=1 Tax=Exocentrus adspersus TaxID=1586481 RepID=A0AAV8VI64_9CUCU|nr:hypothetical protein NQ315_002686 [Exocentrus adspersus]
MYIRRQHLWKHAQNRDIMLEIVRSKIKKTDTASANAVSSSSNSSASTSTNAASTSKSVLTINNNSSHSKYFKDACINNKAIQCYVDLGSSCVTIREDVANELGFSYLETDTQPLVGYSNGLVKPLGLFTGTLSIDDVTAKVKIHVVPKDAQNVPLIVGHPYTEQSHIQITSKSNELRIEYCEDELPNNEHLSETKTNVKLNSDAIIPNNYLGHISVATDLSNQELFMDGGLRDGLDFPIVPRCVIRTDHEGNSILPVMNVTGSDFSLKKGKTLTRAEICTEAPKEVKQEARDDGNEYKREINQKEVVLEEIDTELTGDEADKLLNLLNEYKDSAGFATEPAAQSPAKAQVYPGHSKAKEPVANQPLQRADVPSTRPGTDSEPVRKYRGIGLKDNPLTVEINRLNDNKMKEIGLDRESKVDKVAELLEKNREKQSEYYNRHKVETKKYNLGDLVMVRDQISSTGDSRKLRPRYRGPYKVSKVLDQDRYVVEDITGEQQSGKPYKTILSSERLKLASARV